MHVMFKEIFTFQFSSSSYISLHFVWVLTALQKNKYLKDKRVIPVKPTVSVRKVYRSFLGKRGVPVQSFYPLVPLPVARGRPGFCVISLKK
jgi:hypothetical protein